MSTTIITFYLLDSSSALFVVPFFLSHFTDQDISVLQIIPMSPSMVSDTIKITFRTTYRSLYVTMKVHNDRQCNRLSVGRVPFGG